MSSEKDMADQPKSRRIWPVELFWQIKEAAQSVEPDARVIFRGADGVERSVAKVKIRGFNTIILCEDLND